MNTPAKLGAYALGLAVVFAGTFGAGKLMGGVGTPPAPSGHAVHETTAPGETGPAGATAIPGGLQVSQNGYTLTPLTTKIRPGRTMDFRFTVTGPDGRPVTAYQVEHDKKLHFIVVPRDLGSFQHLHPRSTADGTWTVPLTLPEAGTYRAFADFAPEGADGMTLGVDLYAAGRYEPKPLPEPHRTATVDGYTVTLDGELTPGRASKLVLKVSKDGRPVTDLQPYLGAYGHLVALRGGDLAYLHVHPDGEPGDGKTPSGPEITFYAEVPSRGDYRLFLDFKHGEAVRTADFAVQAGQAAPVITDPEPTATPAEPAESAEHAEQGEHGH
ncbi:hypothetical protein GCM10022226_56240 [Sphaerisporangium flaviroseum]|uniref:Heavy metal-binding domain-containing protein n=1 Tax=Sphaerisporangium flaviroseum TaxID=509199 RepID=A0ABP7IWB7_9ACTN